MGNHWQTKKADDERDDSVSPAEMKAAVDKVMRAFEAFKDTNDRELKEIKSKRGADAVTSEKLDRINRGYDDLKEEVAKLAKKAARPSIGSGQQQNALEVKANGEFARWIGTSDLTKAAEHRIAYKAAFEKWIRAGEEKLTPDERKALSVGDQTSGGFWVEPATSDIIIRKMFETSDMRAIASSVSISTDRMKFAIDRDEVAVTWVGETTARTETEIATLGDITIPVHEMNAQPRITQNLIDDAGIDVQAWLNDKIADKFGRGENSAFCTGNGISKPRGFLTLPTSTAVDTGRSFGTLQHIGTGVSGAFPASAPTDKLIDLIYAFKRQYRTNLIWVMNRTTNGIVRKFKDGQGNYIAGPRIDQNKGVQEVILEYPVQEFADMPDLAANSLSLGLGDFKRGYMIVDRQGIRQLRDPYSAKPYVLYDTTKRVGGDVIDTDAIKFLKFV